MLPVSDLVSSEESTPESGLRVLPPLTEDPDGDLIDAVVVVNLLMLLFTLLLLLLLDTGRMGPLLAPLLLLLLYRT